MDRLKVAYQNYRVAIDNAFIEVSPDNHFLPDLNPIIDHYEPLIKGLVDEVVAIGIRQNV